jgi:hypothetical protein
VYEVHNNIFGWIRLPSPALAISGILALTRLIEILEAKILITQGV